MRDVTHATICLLSDKIKRNNQVRSFTDLVIGKLHRDGLSLPKCILDKRVVLFEVEHDTISHIDKLRYDLL